MFAALALPQLGIGPACVAHIRVDVTQALAKKPIPQKQHPRLQLDDQALFDSPR